MYLNLPQKPRAILVFGINLIIFTPILHSFTPLIFCVSKDTQFVEGFKISTDFNSMKISNFFYLSKN